MSRQDRGFTQNLEKLCQSLDDELQKLLEDLKDYLYQEKRNDKIIVFDEEDSVEQVFTDREIIEEYLRNTSDKNILK